MHKSQKGFTLIELVVVIVLLGILGVTALGKFENLAGEAANAAQQGIASEFSSSAAVNYASAVVGGTSATIAAASCTTGGGAPSTQLDSLMASGAAPTTDLTYAFVSGDVAEDAVCALGETYICSIAHAQATDAAAQAGIICTP